MINVDLLIDTLLAEKRSSLKTKIQLMLAKEFSGQLNIRINQDVHRSLALMALIKGESINSIICSCLQKCAEGIGPELVRYEVKPND